tara:strand:- start:5801 stop:8626 length:2826 start_codon:yes stop_codon:yes gene_type:complete
MTNIFGNGHKLHLIDGSGFIFRAYHALPPLTKSDGTPVGAVAGFCNMIFRMIENNSGPNAPTHIAVVFDHKGKTFRSKIYPEYKANRPPAPEDLIPQFELIKQATEAFNLPSIEIEGYEADDIIASYAIQACNLGAEVTIVSSDKDLMQLVRNGISMFDTMRDKLIAREQVIEKFGVTPEKVIDVQSLAGDSTDNVPGAPGIGIKTAAQLISEFGDLDTLLEQTDKIKQPKRRQTLIQNKNQILVSRQLVTLKTDVPLPLSMEELERQDLEPDIILKFTSNMEFRTLTKRISNKLNMSDNNYDTETSTSNSQKSNTYLEKIQLPPYSNYSVINTKQQLQDWSRKIKDRGYFAVDTETTSLNEIEAELVGISLSVELGEACYIPLAHMETGSTVETLFEQVNLAPNQLPKDEVLKMLKPLLESDQILKIGQNIKYDVKIFNRVGINLTCVDDTMLMSYALHGGLHRHNMNALAEIYLKHEPIKIQSLLGSGKTARTFDKVPVNIAVNYAAEDADVTLRLWYIFKSKLIKNNMNHVYERLERPMIKLLADMELTGISVDKILLTGMSNSLSFRLAELEEQIHTLADQKFNVGSPKQLGEILFNKMNLPGGKKNKNGAYSTSAEILESIAATGNEFTEKVLDWRQMAKLKSTYTDALKDHINSQTNRVHTSYNISGTSTGRLSSAEPNLQNIPIRTEEGRRIRQAFIAKNNCLLLSLDYSQIELRILAHVANIPSLKLAFANNVDIHALTASEMFNVPLNEMTPDIRRKAKAINFGVIYGISAFGLANNLRIPRDQAKIFIETYFERFPQIKEYMDATINLAKRNNYVETLFGRRIHTPNINSKGHEAGFAQRAAINAPIQGSAADIIRRAMIRIPKILASNSLSARMLLQVHDELIFEVPENEVTKTSKLVKEVMETACEPFLKLNVPLVVEAGFGKNWSEAH